jgi:hypothetical protein
MKSTSAAWELLVCIGIGLLISGITDGLSNFFVVCLPVFCSSSLSVSSHGKFYTSALAPFLQI